MDDISLVRKGRRKKACLLWVKFSVKEICNALTLSHRYTILIELLKEEVQ